MMKNDNSMDFLNKAKLYFHSVFSRVTSGSFLDTGEEGEKPTTKC